MAIKSIIQYLFISIIAVGLVSCENFKSEKKEVDELIAQLDSLENKFINLELVSPYTISETVDLELDSIHKMVNENNIVLEQKDLVFLEVYKASGKTKKLKKTFGFVNQNMTICREQLTNLKKDIDNKAIPKKDLPKYIKDERMALKELKASLTELENTRDKMLADFKRLRPEVNDFFKSISK